MNWIKLTTTSQLEDIEKESYKHPVVIFKHSTRCSISAAALSRLERSLNVQEIGTTPFYYLDLLQYRDLSSAIAEKFGVHHESPQILILKDGKAIYHASHMAIHYQEIVKKLHETARL